MIPCEGHWDEWEDPHFRFAAMEQCKKCPIQASCNRKHAESFTIKRYECVVGGISTFGAMNLGGLTIGLRPNGFRLRCKKHKLDCCVPTYGEAMSLAAEHARETSMLSV